MSITASAGPCGRKLEFFSIAVVHVKMNMRGAVVMMLVAVGEAATDKQLIVF
jgi:hypothetical protein